jgi:hypothetical protein
MINEYAILDNIEIMVSFTFEAKDTDTLFYKAMNLRGVITEACKAQGMILDFDSVCRNSYVNFKLLPKKGRSETVLFHFNPLRSLRKELQDTTGETFGSGLQGDTNFIDITKYPFTQEYQRRTISDACNKLQSIVEVCKAISNSPMFKEFRFKPSVKLSLLKLEAVIDKSYTPEEINMYHNMLVQNYSTVMNESYPDLRLHSPDSTVKNQCFYLSINNVANNNHHEKIGQVYLKTNKILRFEHSRNLQDKRYHNCHSKQRFIAIINNQSDASILEGFRQYLQKHLNTTQELYQKSMLLTELMINNH